MPATPIHTPFFRPLNLNESVEAYEMIEDNFNWLMDRGLRQGGRIVDPDAYTGRSVRGQNFGLFADDRLVATTSIVRTPPTEWLDVFTPVTGLIEPNSHWWITSLVSHPATRSQFPRGQGYGCQILQKAEDHILSKGGREILMDCVNIDEFLPGFYASHGYEDIKRRPFLYQWGHSAELILMRKVLPLPAGAPA